MVIGLKEIALKKQLVGPLSEIAQIHIAFLKRRSNTMNKLVVKLICKIWSESQCAKVSLIISFEVVSAPIYFDFFGDVSVVSST